jgi:hypothetical protein
MCIPQLLVEYPVDIYPVLLIYGSFINMQWSSLFLLTTFGLKSTLSNEGSYSSLLLDSICLAYHFPCFHFLFLYVFVSGVSFVKTTDNCILFLNPFIQSAYFN